MTNVFLSDILIPILTNSQNLNFQIKLLEEHGDFAPSTTAAENVVNAQMHMLKLRRRMFKNFKLFREDYLRQPALQEEELARAPKILENATRFLGPRPYGITELRENILEQHKVTIFQVIHKNFDFGF